MTRGGKLRPLSEDVKLYIKPARRSDGVIEFIAKFAARLENGNEIGLSPTKAIINGDKPISIKGGACNNSFLPVVTSQ